MSKKNWKIALYHSRFINKKELDPGRLAYDLGCAYKKLYKPIEAYEYFEMALGDAKDKRLIEDIEFKLIDFYIKQKKLEKAEEILDRHFKQLKNESTLYHYYSIFYFVSDQLQKGEGFLKNNFKNPLRISIFYVHWVIFIACVLSLKKHKNIIIKHWRSLIIKRILNGDNFSFSF